MNKINEVAIIGGGHAGLAVSYCLSQLEVQHIVIEQGQIGESWRSRRWDSFTLVTPNAAIRLPGFHYQGSAPNDFLSAREFVNYLETYASFFQAPIHCGVRVISLQEKMGGGYSLITDQGEIEAAQVVVATGGYQVPKRPSFSRELPADVLQIDAEEYRNPVSLSPGSVLVVGSGQSGAQIAEELHEAGRSVYLAVGRCRRWPRRYRGKDIILWLLEMESKTIDMLPHPRPRFDSNGHVSGKNGGHEINLRKLGSAGVTLLGRIERVEKGCLIIADDLELNLLNADHHAADLKKAVDDLILQRGLASPVEEACQDVAPLKGTLSEPVRRLNLVKPAIPNIIWATGYRMNFGWLQIPVVDEEGFPRHVRGVSTYPGLFFIGLPWLYRGNSSGVSGVEEDAIYISEQIIRNRSAT